MKQTLLAALLFASCLQLPAAEGSGRSVRQSSSSDGERESGEGPWASRRYRNKRTVESGAGSSAVHGTASQGNASSGQGSSTAGTGWPNSWNSHFDQQHPSGYHKASDPRPHYSAPEPSAYGEALLTLGGLGVFALKRRRGDAKL